MIGNSKEHKQLRHWMRLDNAALIFPAIRSFSWVNTFRVSVQLSQEIDPAVLQRAMDELKDRFPTIYVRLGTGLFWYTLVEVKQPPRVREDYAYPLTHMGTREQRTCCFRVFYYKKRIAAEFFHVITDGTGGITYIKALASRYLELLGGFELAEGKGVLTMREKPSPVETEDAFIKCSGKYAMPRREDTAYRLSGTYDATGFRHLITGIIPTDALLAQAHRCATTVNGFLCGVMTRCIMDMQAERLPERRQKPVKITVPVNLRRLFSIQTLRNFALVLNIGVDPRLKDYTVEEICREYNRQTALEAVPEKMAARIAANVLPAKNRLMRLAPLFLKNLVMRTVYRNVGENKGCINISNLGKVDLPDELSPFVERFDFIIGVQFTYPNNCSVVSYGGMTYINMIRNIRETELERRFFSMLVEMGIPVSIESNDDDRQG